MDIYTLGGGEFLTNVLNAIAAWTSSGAFRSLISVVMVLGLIYVTMVVAFSFNAREWVNWFLQATAIYLLMIVPTTTVRVIDSTNPFLPSAVVGNVPIGFAAIASFTSKIGDWMTQTAETVFVMPSSLSVRNNGIIYGARLLEKAQGFQIVDADFRTNLDEHFKQCVFYDVLLGFKSMDTLNKSPDLWQELGNNASSSRAQRYVTRTGATTSSSVITCRAAYDQMSAAFASVLERDVGFWSKSIFPKLSGTQARTKLLADLPVAAQYFHGASAANVSDAYRYLRQVSLVDAFGYARDNFDQAGSDAFAVQRADIQAKNTYTSIAQQAMSWVPLLHIVLTIVFYAMFPILFPLFLFPKTGLTALKGYATGFFYLAAWGPLYSVLHMFVMYRASSAMAASAGEGVTFITTNGITAVNNDIATVAGFLMMSVPFLAAGMAKGAMAIAGQATSMLQPAQAAAEQAANERTTGNYNYGNTQFANSSENVRQANKWDLVPSFASGAPSSSYRTSNGGTVASNADGSSVFDTRGATSSLPITPTKTQGYNGQVRSARAEGWGRVEQVRQSASEATTATANAGLNLLSSAEKRVSSGKETGNSTTDSIAQIHSASNSLAENLQTRFNFSESDSFNLARDSILSGGFSVNAGLSKSGASASGSAGPSTKSVESSSDGKTYNKNYEDAKSYINNEVNSSDARNARESFIRETSSSTDAEVKALSSNYGASLTESKGLSLEASKVEDTYARVSNEQSLAESTGYALSSNESQQFVQFAQQELLKPENRSLAATGWNPSVVVPNREQEAARDSLLGKFNEQRIKDVRSDLGIDIPQGPEFSLRGPGVIDKQGVAEWNNANLSSISDGAPQVNVRPNSSDPSIGALVGDRLSSSSDRILGGGTAMRIEVAGKINEGQGVEKLVDERNNASLASTTPGIRAIPTPSDILQGAKDAWNTADFVSGNPGASPRNQSGPTSFGGNASTPLGKGEGFYNYYTSNGQRAKFANANVVSEMKNSSAGWAAMGMTAVGVGDLGLKGGGNIPKHETHDTGRMVDVRPFRKDGKSLPTTWQSKDYDREQTRSYFSYMKGRNPGLKILFNDPVLIKEGLTQRADDHDNHGHFIFNDSTKASTGGRTGWRKKR
jgi:conjugal transfer mating pair stabilization protein TraG